MIKEARKRLNLKQEHLATMLGISQEAVSRIENGKLEPRGNVRVKMEELLGIKLKPSRADRMPLLIPRIEALSLESFEKIYNLAQRLV